jgi:hypothetical protein
VLGLGLVAGALLVAADLSPTLSIDIHQAGTCEIVADPGLRDECAPSGGSRHLYGFVLLGLLALPMAWGAGIAGSRPAAVALLVIGAAVLAIALARDLPATDETGAIGVSFEQGEASPASGFWLSLAGGVLGLAAGALALRGGARLQASAHHR